MKKVIYGILILLGMCLVSTNFIVDNSNIDYKNASASGTACKWISESGYGVGPYYVADPHYKIAGSYINYVKSDTHNFAVLPCTTVQALDTKDGYLLYEQTGNPYTGYLGMQGWMISENNAGTDKHGFIYNFFSFKDGIIYDFDGHNILSGSSSILKSGLNNSTPLNYNDGKGLFTKHFSASVYEYFYDNGDNGNDLPVSGWGSYSEYPTDINNDDKWTFTCVCAEY